jgi:hypothetical protein
MYPYSNAGFQDILLSAITLTFRSTRNQRGNCNPILAPVHLHRILQLDVFVFCPCTRASSRPVHVGIHDILPSLITLTFRSTLNQRDRCTPRPYHRAFLLHPSA